jgi:periplasmic protein CpxP/Spy
MKSISHDRLVSAAVAALLMLPAAALAQAAQSAAVQGATPPPAASTSPMAGHPVAGKNAQERVERRIKELHGQLHITPAEEPQWNQFAEVMRANARDMDQAFMQRAQRFETMNAVQNMQSYEKIAEQHTQRLQKLIPAFENLYNAMPDQQKQLADQVFRANAERHAQQATQSHRGRHG